MALPGRGRVLTGAAVPTVRPALASEADAVAARAAATFPLACPPGTSPEAMTAHIRDNLHPAAFAAWAADPAVTLMVAGDDAVVGYALVLAGPCGDRDATAVLASAGVDTSRVHELSKIYVAASAQGSGLAGALLEDALAAAVRDHGASPVWLGTNVENARAQAFYARHGFVTVGTRAYVVGGQRHSDVVMLREAAWRS